MTTPGAPEATMTPRIMPTPEELASRVKVCCVCHIEKPWSAFKIHCQRCIPRFRCRDCDVEAVKVWRKTEPGRANARARARVRRQDPDYWEWWKGYLARTRDKPINRAREARHALRYRLKY